MIPGGSLEGELIGVKDLFRVDGLPTTAGSALPPEVFGGPESGVVQVLKHAGAVVLGKTTTDEFGYSEPPPTRNPRDLSRTPGGSSSGSAAAVAAGMCRLAIGSQTLQSTITPASYCGVVGFATSHGRVPFDGIGAAPSLDTVGFLGDSVRTIADALAVTVSDWKGTERTTPRIGICNPWGARRLHTEAWTAFANHAAALRGAGFECKAATMPWDSERGVDLSRSIGDLLNAEFAELHAEWFDRFGHLYRQRTADAIVRGREVDAYRVAEARSRRRAMVAELEDLTEATGVDCWVCPAGQLAPLDRESTDNWMTRFWAFAGWPAVTLPVFDGPAGLPHGLQVVARHGQDEQLIGWASTIAATVGSRQDGAR